jgi:TPP-dependent 2-oxoacid decarboxylase
VTGGVGNKDHASSYRVKAEALLSQHSLSIPASAPASISAPALNVDFHLDLDDHDPAPSPVSALYGKQVVCLVGDGALQCATQELSTLIRNGLKAIVIVVNNEGYAVEVKIHDGDYNRLQNWKYSGLVDVFNGHCDHLGEASTGMGLCVMKSDELGAALEKAYAHTGFALIECRIAQEDVSPQLMDFGPRLVAYTSRGPSPR